MKLMNVKGTFDYLPKDMNIRNQITDTLRKNFDLYGYAPIETPIINYYDLLSYKYEDDAEILSEIYRLTDQGERDLGLRYDLTVPFCKVVAMNKNLNMPFRRYEIGRVFRNGPVKLGRTREFYQCDIDVVGIDNRFIEAEQISMAIKIFKDLGIDIIVKYNNRKLMSGLILYTGIEEDKINKVIGVIDKLEKVQKEELYEMLINLQIPREKIDNLLNIFTKEIDYYKEISEENNLIKEGVSELEELNQYLKDLNILGNCIFTPTLARGLSIYTGVVFEFYDKEKRVQSAIGAGGRYNKIITNFINDGKEYPAVGLSFGLEPIFVILKEMNKFRRLIDIYMVPLDTNTETLKLANIFRENGYRVLIEMNKKKIGKCFEYAERENIKYVMILGENEINTNIFKIKDMEEKNEYSFTKEELLTYLKIDNK
ncbi:MAG: histidine--tRNA ligase [Mycoplasmatota bacterium]|nr:histidine--tRNA ligase [Mycoplasmatota bacterium]